MPLTSRTKMVGKPKDGMEGLTKDEPMNIHHITTMREWPQDLVR